MSLIFTESFDWSAGSNADMVGKWAVWQGNLATAGNVAGHGYYANNINGSRILLVEEDDGIILGFRMRMSGGVFAQTLCRFYSDAAATLQCEVRTTGSGEIGLYRGDGTLLGSLSAAGKLQANVFHYVEVKVKVADSGGSFDIRIDNVSVASGSALDTRNGGTDALVDNIVFVTGDGTYIDDIYVCNEAGTINNDFLGDCHVEALLPDANGNYSQFVGSDANSVDNYLLVDDPGAHDGDTTYVESGTDDQKDSYQVADMAAAGTIKGIVQWAIARRDQTGARDIAFFTRLSGVDSAASADQTLAASYAWHRAVWETKPGGGAWTVANLNADEAEFGVISRP